MKNITLESRFSVLRQIGAGGFSQVFKVEDKEQNNKVFALKRLNFTIDQTDAQEQLKVFHKEVVYLKKLQHNRIVRIVEELLIDNHPAILMELVEGVSLQAFIDREEVLPAAEVMDIAQQVSAALLACHTFQIPREKLGLTTETVLLQKYAIVHNDISAKNIIKETKADGTTNYKLIDFGLSYVPSEIKSGDNVSQGTLEYYPPEKWSGEKVTPSSDIYSFGVVLYQMLAGKVPFEIANYSDFYQVELAKKHHLESNLPDLWEIRKEKLLNKQLLKTEQPDYPYWFQQLIEKCLAKNPKERFKTGEELNRHYQEGRRGNLTSEWPNEINHEEEDAWLKAYATNTVEAYLIFIKKYSKSKYVAKANEEIDYLKEVERKKQWERIEWDKAQRKDTLEAYKDIELKSKDNEYVKLAKAKIKALEAEEKDWQLAVDKNTKTVYKQFLKHYPNSQYCSIAEGETASGDDAFFAKRKKTVSENKKLLLICGIVVGMLLVSFVFKERVSRFVSKIQQEEVMESSEPIDLVKAYYRAYYIDKDYDKILNTYLAYPFVYNEQEYTKKSFEKVMKGNGMFANYLKTTSAYKIINKQVKIDSLVIASKEMGKFKVYGAYSFVKKKKGGVAVKNKFAIKDELTIIDGVIKGIKK